MEGTFSDIEGAANASACRECNTEACGPAYYRETCGEGRVRDAECRIGNGLFAVAVLSPLIFVVLMSCVMMVMRKTRRVKTFVEMTEIHEEDMKRKVER
jgi:hypothetical protein